MAYVPPVGQTTDPDIFLDNVKRADELVNGPAGTVNDRGGVPLDTWRQMMAKNDEIRQNIIPLSKQYMTLADAQADIANIPDGSTTYVRSPDGGTLADEYINNGGTLGATGRKMPAQGAIDNLIKLLNDESEVSHDLVDVDGFSLWRLFISGAFGTIKSMISPDGVFLSGLSISHDGGDAGLRYEDSEGFYFNIIGPDGLSERAGTLNGEGRFITKSGDNGWLTLEDADGFYKILADKNGVLVGATSNPLDLSVADAQNKLYSQNIRGQYNSEVQRLVSGLNHLLIYSQSLGTYQEGWPALSKTPIAGYDNLMLGDSIRPSSRLNPAFVPLGEPVLKPMRAVVQTLSGKAVLTDAEEAALPAGAQNEGEGGVAMANFLRKLWLQKNNLESDSTRRFVTTCSGVNGQTIEALSKGATPELYQRPLQAVQQVKALAGAASYSIGALLWIQGEWNYSSSYGGDQTKAGYKAKMHTLFTDMISDMAVGIAGQESPPAIFMYQTGGSFSVDTYDLAIGMAQWEYCMENKNAYLTTPAYPYPDKGGHLTANGYRWMDMQFAKVMHRVLNEGQGWEPLGPRKITITGNVIFVFYHVPYPPLQFRPSYVGRTATMYADKGFRVTDSAGAVAISSVEIVADTIIKITLATTPTGDTKLWYGDKTTHGGNGNVFDSDPFVASENYVYTEGSGQYADENIPELVGKPYPLNNPSVQFCLPVNFGE
ncbi:sialate O-acetylesterase [Klebsiella pneumoniae]|nr:sialate O-acetylesterase [Klebsiella pneumoniae]